MRDRDRFARSTMWFFLIAVALIGAGIAQDIVAPAGHRHASTVALGSLAIVVGIGVLGYGVRAFRRLH
jgi:hypothetical protein